jgi:hypothetical protein
MRKLSAGTVRIISVLLSIVWLAVVGTAIWLAVTRFDRYGVLSLVAIGIAVVMLAIFVVERLGRKRGSSGTGRPAANWLTGALILGAVVMLVASVVKGYGNLGLGGSAVLILFALAFVRIFIDFVRDARKPGPGRKQKAEKRCAEDDDEAPVSS